MSRPPVIAARRRQLRPADLAGNERRTRLVVVITAVTMVVELVVGWMTNSMALTADGWHMATHAGALGLSLVGYWFARERAGDARFNFGTGKVFALTGFASAMILGLVALEVGLESASRLLTPLTIDFSQALPVAVLGLVVNLICALILQGGAQGDGHHHGHSHSHGHGDQNLRAAYLHVIADALTSLLAILALLAGWQLGWNFLDPMMGIVGGLLIARWAWFLSRDCAAQLLDEVPNAARREALIGVIEATPQTWVSDLYLWTLGPNQEGCLVSIVAEQPESPEHYRQLLRQLGPLALVMVEVEALPAVLSESEARHDHSHEHGHSHSPDEAAHEPHR